MAEPFELAALTLGPLGANCFILARDGRGLVFDPGDEAPQVVGALDTLGAAPRAILLTHGHFDHIGAVATLAERYDVPVYIGAGDVGELGDRGLGALAGFEVRAVSDPITLSGERELELVVPVVAIPTPGHSRGSYSFSVDGHLFVGDLLFYGSVGRTDLPGGSSAELLNSIATLIRRFPPDAEVHCGHGPDTSLGRELALNPFLSPLRHDPGHRW
ncbi:MAG TPA: MBL fold metallo-hydrolase [Thermoleophilia bacterium]|nr:MBL fold metallo-hydrolase [Thermoleophilia bacterium]